MRTETIAILGTPFACWALYGCLAIMGVAGAPAIAAAIAWGVLWLVIAHFGRNTLLRRRQSTRCRTAPGGRGLWTGAVLGSYLLPIPVCLLTLLVVQLGVTSASMVLPLFVMLGMPVPSALWWMVLWPSQGNDAEVVRPLGWRRYTPHAPSGIIPPRSGRNLGE
ncbi:MAG: hypothetical protein ABIP93_01860 [Gemmatimonadaceae bacterium]